MSKTQKVKKVKADESVNQQKTDRVEAVAPASRDKVFTAQDKALLEKQESVITSNIGAFLLIGEALSLIKKEDLQKVSDPKLTFEEYCSKKWGFGQAYAYRLISAYECVKHLREEMASKGVVIFPANESQVRSLVSLSPKDQVKAWFSVLEKAKGGSITAAMVDEVVNDGPAKTGKSETAAKPKVAAAKAGQKKLKTIAKLVDKALKVEPAKRNIEKWMKVLEKIQKLIQGDRS